MKQKRFMCLLLTLCMLFTLAPVSVFADETSATTPTSTSVTVSFTTQAEGVFLHAPQNNITVASDLAENYGYTDKVENGVSALDVLVKAHETAYGAEFNTSNCGEYLSLSEDFATDVFGLGSAFGFVINGKQANDGIFNEAYNAYTGYALTQAQVIDGDLIDFYFYQSEGWSDNYIWFEKDTAKIDSLLIKENTDTMLTVKGYSIGWYGCSTQETIDSLTTEVDSVQLCLVDSVTGTTTDINEAITDENGIVTFSVADKGEYLLSAYSTNDSTPAIMPLVKLKVGYPDAAITIPNTSKLFVGEKSKHFVAFKEYEPVVTEEGTDTITYYFDIPNNKQCNYRISGENHLTYTGLFKKTAEFALIVDKETLTEGGTDKKAIDRNTANNNGYNVADIYLNINSQGYLKLDVNETYQLINLRNWEAVDSTTNNYFLEPDYHYTVIDENGNADDSVIEISNDGVITAKSSGTAIVLVTYDAFNNVSAVGGPFFGAIWPENTGVFVVGVGLEDSEITTNMTANVGQNSTDSKLSGDAIDAEHDVIYFVGDTGSYTFTPETANCNISVANPTINANVSYTGFMSVEKADDNSFSVPLTEGRNIVKIEKDGKAEYQVITAKKVNITINNGDAVKPGDKLSIAFDRLYHPANKLAGVYNMSSVPIYKNVSAYDGKIIGGIVGQYNFASNNKVYTIENILKEKNMWGNISYEKDIDLVVPEDYPYDTFYLSSGMIYTSGFGDPFGNHRGITLENGKAPNLNANARKAYLGLLPDIEIPITAPGSELKSISLTVTDVKTEYYIGDSFDTTNLVVTANYEDDKTQLTENYTVTPTVLDADTEKVIITYRGQTAEIPVTVKEDKVSAVNIKNNPAKVSYKTGETFDPTGMVVEAVYNSGKKTETYEYTYEPKRALNTDDAQITVVYIGANADANVLSAAVPITVTPSGGGGTSSPSDKITVYFTLYGDKKHGTPTNATGTHTLADGNLKTWISKTAIEVERGSYVIDVVKKALGLNGIPYSNPSGNYIESIKGLGEFDNGSESGWMYTLNGKHPELGVGEQTVKNNDKIVFHYTDSYSKEDSADKWVSSGSNGGGIKNDNKDETKTEESNAVKTETTVSGTTATVTTSEKNITNAIATAKKDNTIEIIISSGDTKNADTIKLEIPANSVKEIAESKDLTLTVATNAGDVAISNETLNAIIEQSGDKEALNVVIETKTVDETIKNTENITEIVSQDVLKNATIVEVTITSGNTSIRAFGGHKLSVDVPVDGKKHEKGKIYKVHIISADGNIDTTYGECIEKNGKLSVRIATKHLSSFVVTDIETAPFTDIPKHWAYEAIKYTYNNSIMQGVGESIFAPDETMTRAMLVTVIYRLENEPAVNKSIPFVDVKAGEWYSNAVTWAQQNGIVSGVSETEFAPNKDITREQMAAILYRYAQYKKHDTSVGENTNILSYDDAFDISEYAYSAIQWMVGAGLLKGETESTINPQGNCTRAQVSTILMRYLEM